MAGPEDAGLYGSVLHATDLGFECGTAFEHALRIVLNGKGALRLLHVSDPDDDEAPPSFPSVRAVLRRWGMVSEGASRRDVARLGIDVAKVRVRRGAPAQEIVRQLRRRKFELLVVGTGQRVGLSRLLQASVAEHSARAASTPTLFVPHDGRAFVSSADGRTTLERVLVPVDHAPAPGTAVEGALRLVATVGCGSTQLRMLHVGERFPAVHLDAERVLEPNGDVVDHITGHAEWWQAQVIVMASQGRAGVVDALRGSTFERVVRRSPCPVLMIPENGAGITPSPSGSV